MHIYKFLYASILCPKIKISPHINIGALFAMHVFLFSICKQLHTCCSTPLCPYEVNACFSRWHLRSLPKRTTRTDVLGIQAPLSTKYCRFCLLHIKPNHIICQREVNSSLPPTQSWLVSIEVQKACITSTPTISPTLKEKSSSIFDVSQDTRMSFLNETVATCSKFEWIYFKTMLWIRFFFLFCLDRYSAASLWS